MILKIRLEKNKMTEFTDDELIKIFTEIAKKNPGKDGADIMILCGMYIGLRSRFEDLEKKMILKN